MDPKQIIRQFNLQHNDTEGGYYASTFTSPYKVNNSELPGFLPANGKHTLSDAIYYFLDKNEISAMHRVTGDMLYHFYQGDPVEMLILYPEGSPVRSEVFVFSNNLDSGGQPMKHIPGGAWLGSRIKHGGHYAFMGVVMAPGFDPADYTIGKRAELISQYPDQKELITALTKG